MGGQKRNKEPNLIIKFDGEKYSDEEQSLLIWKFIQVLSGIDKRIKEEKKLCI